MPLMSARTWSWSGLRTYFVPLYVTVTGLSSGLTSFACSFDLAWSEVIPPTFTPPIRMPSAILLEFARSIAYAATANAMKIPTTEARAICALRPNEQPPRSVGRGSPGAGSKQMSQARLRQIKDRWRAPPPLKPQRLAVGGHAAPLTRVLATHVRAPAQKLLDLALVGVLLLGAAHHLCQAHVL